MSQVILFENDEPKTIFAPIYKWHMYEGEVKVGDIRNTILTKENEVINSHEYESDWNTGLGKDSMTSRSSSYNLLNWEEADHIKDIIRNSHDNLITTLDPNMWEDKIYVQCWANVLRKGQRIKPHQHWTSKYTYLGGHICVHTEDTNTYYSNPYNRESFISKKDAAKIRSTPINILV